MYRDTGLAAAQRGIVTQQEAALVVLVHIMLHVLNERSLAARTAILRVRADLRRALGSATAAVGIWPVGCPWSCGAWRVRGGIRGERGGRGGGDGDSDGIADMDGLLSTVCCHTDAPPQPISICAGDDWRVDCDFASECWLKQEGIQGNSLSFRTRFTLNLSTTQQRHTK